MTSGDGLTIRRKRNEKPFKKDSCQELTELEQDPRGGTIQSKGPSGLLHLDGLISSLNFVFFVPARITVLTESHL